MAERTWERVELPILEAIAALEEEQLADDRTTFGTEAIERAGIDMPRGRRAVGDLAAAGYVSFMRGSYDFIGIRLLPAGRRVVGQWPREDLAAEFLIAIEAALVRATAPEERDRLGRLKDAIQDVSTGTVSALLATVVGQHVGMR